MKSCTTTSESQTPLPLLGTLQIIWGLNLCPHRGYESVEIHTLGLEWTDRYTK